MADEGFKRKLTAILSADVEGYSRLAGPDKFVTWDEAKAWVEGLSVDGGGCTR